MAGLEPMSFCLSDLEKAVVAKWQWSSVAQFSVSAGLVPTYKIYKICQFVGLKKTERDWRFPPFNFFGTVFRNFSNLVLRNLIIRLSTLFPNFWAIFELKKDLEHKRPEHIFKNFFAFQIIDIEATLDDPVLFHKEHH